MLGTWTISSLFIYQQPKEVLSFHSTGKGTEAENICLAQDCPAHLIDGGLVLNSSSAAPEVMPSNLDVLCKRSPACHWHIHYQSLNQSQLLQGPTGCFCSFSSESLKSILHIEELQVTA